MEHWDHCVARVSVIQKIGYTHGKEDTGITTKYGDDTTKHRDDNTKHSDDTTKHSDDAIKHSDDATTSEVIPYCSYRLVITLGRARQEMNLCNEKHHPAVSFYF